MSRPIPFATGCKATNEMGVGGQGDFELFGSADAPRTFLDGPPADLPDLVPSSPSSFSPPNPHSYLHRTERSSSLPAFERMKPPRRRTLELRDQASFVPTLFGRRSDDGSASASGSASSGSSGEEGSTSSAAPTGTFWNPHTDQCALLSLSCLSQANDSVSPLSIPEQQDLLDRMRRDLLGVDLDAIKGPFRALALSSLPRQSQRPIKLHPSDESLSKTISPKDAFLDYNDVDHRLHAAKRLSSGSYGLGGVGSAGSLFAPLPSPSHAPQGTSVSSPIAQRAISTSPRLASLPTPPGHRRAKSHPFSVPKNAVAWVDKEEGAEDDSTGGMVDFRESSDGDEVETPDEAGPAEVEEVIPMPSAPKEAAMDVESSSEEEDDDDRPPNVVPEAEIMEDRSRTPLASRRMPATTAAFTPPSAFAPPPASFPTPPPPRLSRPTSRPTSRPSPRSTSHPSPRPTSRPPGTSPRLASPPFAVNKSVANTEGDDSSPEVGEESSDEYVPAPSLLPRRVPRKRSRTPAAMEESESEASEEASESSDERPKGRRGAAAPNKRRRRVPPASGSTTGGTLRCTHVGPEGRCATFFRRPYDLERHKETIHGEGAGGKVEWVCKTCQGSFSRRDALLRHSRIRGHTSGI